MKKAAVKIIVVVAMTAAMLCNAVVPVNALSSNISYYITTSMYSFANHKIVNIPGQVSGYYGILLQGDIKTNYTYSFVIQYKLQGSTTILEDGVLTTAVISNLSNTNLNVNNLQNAISIPRSQISIDSTTYMSSNNTIVITINTNDLPISNGNSIFLDFQIVNPITINSVNLYGIEDSNQKAFESISNNISNIANEINNLTTQNTTINNSLQEIVTNTQQIEDIQNIINQNIITTNNKLDTVNSSVNTVNQSIQYITNYGQNNNTPEGGSNLSSAQDNLHNAEDAIKSKSDNFITRASSGISTAISSSGQFVSNMAQPVASVTSTITSAVNTLPEEVKPMVMSMPLLSFAVWLIGLKK